MGRIQKDSKIVGLAIRQARKTKGWNQQQLAEAMGYADRSTIAKIETGASDVNQSTVKKLAEVLGVSVIEILGLSADNDEDELLHVYKELPPDSQKHLIAYAKFLRKEDSR